MPLKLHKPICFFDLETTGINISKDRIVEISILKINPDSSKESKSWIVNPEIPIPKESSDIHGITDKDIVDAPTFKDISKKVYIFIQGADLAGYNSNRFDIPLLAEELLRVELNFDFSNTQMIDVQTIFHKMEKRTLEAAYKFYCNKTLKNAHSAEADTLATFEVLEAQLEYYPDLKNNVKWLAEFSKQKKYADFAGFIVYNDNNEAIFSFGKYKDQKVYDVLDKDKGYFNWIQNADFPLYTKKVLTAIKLKKLSIT